LAQASQWHQISNLDRNRAAQNGQGRPLTAFAVHPRPQKVARTIVNLGACPPLSMRHAVDDGRRNKRGDRDPGVEFIAENGGRLGVRLRKGDP
jgi:hypothetical protein